jgi:lipoprotein-releasing system permease protein
MGVEGWMAQRYLRAPHRPPLLRLVSWLSVLGVGAGVVALEVALAMNTGFRGALADRLLEMTAHVNIQPTGRQGLADWRGLATQVETLPDVQAVAPALYNTVLLSANGQARGVVLKGVDPERERATDRALAHLVAGDAAFAPDADGIPALVVGQVLAREFHLSVNDYVTLTAPQLTLSPLGPVPRAGRFRVTGIFASGLYDFDANWVLVPLGAAQRLAGLGDVVGVVEVRLRDPARATAVAERLVRRLGSDYRITTWMEQNRALFRALSLEKLVTALFVGLITFVAGMNILVALSLAVVEHAPDMAVLMALGARRRQVHNIFLYQGLLMGLIGTLGGGLLGYAGCWAADRWRLIPLNPEIYAISYVPFRPTPADALWVAAVALGVSALATLYPARAAARLEPVDILRYQ